MALPSSDPIERAMYRACGELIARLFRFDPMREVYTLIGDNRLSKEFLDEQVDKAIHDKAGRT